MTNEKNRIGMLINFAFVIQSCQEYASGHILSLLSKTNLIR